MIRFYARGYVLGLLIVAILLIATHLCLYAWHYAEDEVPWLILQLFDLDEENNLPSWFSSFLLLNNAAVVYLLQQHKDQYLVQWKLIAIGFLILSIDEVAGLHESFHTAINFHWVIAAAALIGIVFALFVPFMYSMERRLLVLYVVSAALFLGGALGVEYLARDMEEEMFDYALATSIEEGMEMLGALLFLNTNLRELRQLPETSLVIA
ncbi:MAG: hypothetical protein JJ921_16430 [Pseudomonadales bacterium]|nr:hypothetical protein [Pseudomonadales bacterium]MBO6597303.1 hypothetical protein [Pseudomonadales bacterium]MBO6703932.1 hypothetical protein [Pseudomonadales bacterium]MBO6823512.1 hypothetical protein [Pseudomonadales bacterium]MBO7006983.1 hypothetical protein [Pseudomonadales bacterium]